MTAPALRVGIIGLGVGEQHALACASNPACAVTAVCDLDRDKLEAIGARFPGALRTTDPAVVLTSPTIDVVSIATYDDVHAEQVRAAIEHGKHVFVEKPLCLRLSELREIRSALRARPEVRLSSNLILRLSPRLRRIRAMLDAGELGRLFHVEGDYNYGRLHKLTDGWRGRLLYYSVVLGGAVHVIDALLWLTREPVTEVTAYGNAIASAGSSSRHPDMVVAILKFRSGLTGKITANFGCVRPHGHGFALYGTAATFINEGDEVGRLHTSRDPRARPATIDDPHPGAAKGDLIASFIASILDGSAPIVGDEDVFMTMSVCLAVEQSLLEGRSVRVQYV